jgi:Zn-dependent protease with chaperone function
MTERHLGSRAAVLLVAWLGFYLLGFSLSGALLWVPWAQSEFGGGPDPSGLLAGFGGLWVLWGLRPRFARKREEGLPIPDGSHRRLMELVDEVARQTGFRKPDEVHLIVHANAFTYATRSLWKRDKTVIGIGLPLFIWLDRDALRSVIAHEIGHHIGGDLRLGPWVHRTRRAIALALDHLEGSSFLLDLPFALYGDSFLKRSLEVARAQELQADRVAAKMAGAAAAGRALSVIERRSGLWTVFFHTEIVPALERGFLLPMAEGFALFERNVERGAVTDGARLEKRVPEPTSEHDTHPSLAERLQSLEIPEYEPKDCETSSLDLFDDPASAEELAIRYVLVDSNKKLERIGWAETAEKIWLPHWLDSLKPAGLALAKLTPGTLAEATSSLDEWAEHTRTGLALLSPQASRVRAENCLGMWLALCLSRSGFTIHADPGSAVRAVRGDTVLEPFRIVKELASGKREAEGWKKECEALGIS